MGARGEKMSLGKTFFKVLQKLHDADGRAFGELLGTRISCNPEACHALNVNEGHGYVNVLNLLNRILAESGEGSAIGLDVASHKFFLLEPQKGNQK
jgi:hypothetical protein